MIKFKTARTLQHVTPLLFKKSHRYIIVTTIFIFAVLCSIISPIFTSKVNAASATYQVKDYSEILSTWTHDSMIDQLHTTYTWNTNWDNHHYVLFQDASVSVNDYVLWAYTPDHAMFVSYNTTGYLCVNNGDSKTYGMTFSSTGIYARADPGNNCLDLSLSTTYLIDTGEVPYLQSGTWGGLNPWQWDEIVITPPEPQITPHNPDFTVGFNGMSGKFKYFVTDDLPITDIEYNLTGSETPTTLTTPFEQMVYTATYDYTTQGTYCENIDSFGDLPALCQIIPEGTTGNLYNYLLEKYKITPIICNPSIDFEGEADCFQSFYKSYNSTDQITVSATSIDADNNTLFTEMDIIPGGTETFQNGTGINAPTPTEPTCGSWITDFGCNINQLLKVIFIPDKDDISALLNTYKSNTYGLEAMITQPLIAMAELTTVGCSDLDLPLPFVNTDLTLPCMGTVYTTHFGAFFTMYQTIITGLISYWVVIKLFSWVKHFQEPKSGRIEVLDL